MRVTKQKMQEYMDNGARLGWLIDPRRERVTVYTPGQVEELEGLETLRGDPVLPGFTLDMRKVWG